MALGDITPYISGNGQSTTGGKVHQVASGGTPPAINAGELVSKTLGNQFVITNPSSGQAVATNFLAGVSLDTSTESATLAGIVTVKPVDANDVWLIAPAVAATWATQALYNALVGSRVLIQKVGGVYTILAADSSTNGCVVENLNIVQYPGKVAFSLREGLSYTA